MSGDYEETTEIIFKINLRQIYLKFEKTFWVTF